MNVETRQDARQPWHLIAHVDGGNEVVSQENFRRLENLIRGRKPVIPVMMDEAA